MTIQVTGQLLDPLGNPIPEAIIRLTAEVSEGNTPEASFSLYSTDSNGFYHFTVAYGRYLLEINPDDEYKLTATVIADISTPSPINIIEWSNYATPITPPVIVPGTPDWTNLHTSLRNDGDTERRTKVDQLSDGDLYVNNTKELLQNPRLDAEMSQDTHETNAGTAKIDQQTNVYNDGVNNQSIQVSTIAEAGVAKSSQTHELYKASDGTSIANRTDEVTGGGGTYQLIANMDEDEATRDVVVTHGDSVTLIKDINKTGLANHTISAKVGTGREAKQEIESIGSDSTITQTADDILFKDHFDNTIMQVDTTNRKVVISGQLQITNTDDFKGEPGDTIFEVFQYSKDNNITDPWHDNFNYPEDIWRRQNTSVNGYIDPTGWSEGMLLIAEDGLPGDTLYWDYKYSTTDALPDPYNPSVVDWHDDLMEGDLYRIECKVVDGIYQLPWSAPARIRGFDGLDGNIVELEYSYSTNGVVGSSWHFNFVTGDHFRRERYIFFHTQAERDAYIPVTNDTWFQATPWNNVAQIVPINGVDYGAKQATVYLFQRGDTEPAPPSGDLVYSFVTLSLTPTANLNGWSQEIPAGSSNIWVAIAVASALGDDSDPIVNTEWNISKWSAAGFNQATVTLYQKVPVGDPDPIPPTHDLTFEFATHDFAAGSDLQGWSKTIPAGADKLWGCIASAYSANVNDVIHPSEWTLTDQGAVGLNQANMTIYQRAATEPLPPSADATYDFTTGVLTGLDRGWQNTILDGTDPLWVGLATAISYDSVDTIPPAEWNISKLAEDGKTVAVSNLFCVTANETIVPNVGFGTCTQNLIDGSVTFSGPNPEGWSNIPPNNPTTAGCIWHITDAVLVLSGATVAFHLDSDYSPPTINTRNGNDGIDGLPGRHGSGSWIIIVPSVPVTDADKDAALATVAGRPAQDSDIANFTDSLTTPTFSRYFLRDGAGHWTEFNLVIDGNAIINGTLAAEKLIAGTITGDYINATTTIFAGTAPGSICWMSGEMGTRWAFVAGNADTTSSGGSAPYRVGHDGSLHATNANITGNINATSGTFDNVTVNNSTINNADINTATIDNAVIGTTRITNTCIIEGTVDARNITGAISAVKTVTHTERQLNSAGGWANLATTSTNANTIPMTVTALSFMMDNMIRDQWVKVRLRSSGGAISETSTIYGTTTGFGGPARNFNVIIPPLSIDVGTAAQTIYLEYQTRGSNSGDTADQEVVFLASPTNVGYFR